MNQHDKWVLYELEKRALQSQDLTAEEYEEAIRQLTEKLRV